MQVTTALPITYVYRLTESDPMQHVRRPRQGYTNHEWINHLAGVRSRLIRNAGVPFYENLTVHGHSVRCPGRFVGRHSEIATALSRLELGCKPADQPYTDG